MEKYLHKLEERLNTPSYENENFNSENQELSAIQEVLSAYKIFGDNLLEIPAKKFKGKYEGYTPMGIPFRFFDFKNRASEDSNDFTSYAQFKGLIPDTFSLIGLLNMSKIIAVNSKNNKIYAFNYSDLTDVDHLNYLIKTPICSINGFLKDLRPQTMVCLADLNNSSKYECIKIDGHHLFHEIHPLEKGNELSDDFIISEEDMQEEYFKRIYAALEKGYKIVYAPQFVWKRFSRGN